MIATPNYSSWSTKLISTSNTPKRMFYFSMRFGRSSSRSPTLIPTTLVYLRLNCPSWWAYFGRIRPTYRTITRITKINRPTLKSNKISTIVHVSDQVHKWMCRSQTKSIYVWFTRMMMWSTISLHGLRRVWRMCTISHKMPMTKH